MDQLYKRFGEKRSNTITVLAIIVRIGLNKQLLNVTVPICRFTV